MDQYQKAIRERGFDIMTKANEIVDLAEGGPVIPLPDPPPDPDPPQPPLPQVLWNPKRKIGVVRISPDSHAGISFPSEWKSNTKIKRWEWFRDDPPPGKEKNPLRDRYFFPAGWPVFVYTDGSNYRKKLGYRAFPGPGSASHAWEIVPGQYCERGKRLIWNPLQMDKMELIDTPDLPIIEKRIFLLARLCDFIVPVEIPKDERDQLGFSVP